MVGLAPDRIGQRGACRLPAQEHPDPLGQTLITIAERTLAEMPRERLDGAHRHANRW
jgi:hypothetical protein